VLNDKKAFFHTIINRKTLDKIDPFLCPFLSAYKTADD
jgi:hypothetical protein